MATDNMADNMLFNGFVLFTQPVICCEISLCITKKLILKSLGILISYFHMTNSNATNY